MQYPIVLQEIVLWGRTFILLRYIRLCFNRSNRMVCFNDGFLVKICSLIAKLILNDRRV